VQCRLRRLGLLLSPLPRRLRWLECKRVLLLLLLLKEAEVGEAGEDLGTVR